MKRKQKVYEKEVTNTTTGKSVGLLWIKQSPFNRRWSATFCGHSKASSLTTLTLFGNYGETLRDFSARLLNVLNATLTEVTR